jgi:AmmeMemoRadiSam system protein B
MTLEIILTSEIYYTSYKTINSVVENVRKAIATGQSYPSDQIQLRKALEDCFHHSEGPGELFQSKMVGSICGVIVPHDQITRSGPIAAHAYHRIAGKDEFDSVLLVGPCQKNVIDAFSIFPSGIWETPLGQVEVDEQTCKKIADDFPKARLDPEPFLNESAIEVQIPFLQYVLKRPFKIVPICISHDDVHSCIEFGKAISKLVIERRALVVGISNLTENQIYAQTLQKDAIVYERLTKPAATDMIKLYELMKEKKMEVSGYGPLTIVLTVAKHLGANKIEGAKYGTSGQITGDYSSVGGYCAMVYVKS